MDIIKSGFFLVLIFTNQMILATDDALESKTVDIEAAAQQIENIIAKKFDSIQSFTIEAIKIMKIVSQFACDQITGGTWNFIEKNHFKKIDLFSFRIS